MRLLRDRVGNSTVSVTSARRLCSDCCLCDLTPDKAVENGWMKDLS